MILCIISAVVPSKNYFYMQVCVAVTPYIFGCNSMFTKISVANISYTGTVFFCAVIQFHTFKSTALCCRIDRMKKDDMIINMPLECTF